MLVSLFKGVLYLALLTFLFAIMFNGIVVFAEAFATVLVK